MRWRKAGGMTDVELTRAVERCEIANENFNHDAHLHVAWVYLTESQSLQQAATKMRHALRQFAAAAGKPEKYHETITLFWLYLLSHAHAAGYQGQLEEIVRANPQMLEKNLPLAYYSEKRLFSDEARTSWIEPDLKPFSFDDIVPCSSSPPRDAPDRSLS
jgi:hypothetical protein